MVLQYISIPPLLPGRGAGSDQWYLLRLGQCGFRSCCVSHGTKCGVEPTLRASRGLHDQESHLQRLVVDSSGSQTDSNLLCSFTPLPLESLTAPLQAEKEMKLRIHSGARVSIFVTVTLNQTHTHDHDLFPCMMQPCRKDSRAVGFARFWKRFLRRGAPSDDMVT